MDTDIRPQAENDLSAYRVFSREEWAVLRADTPLTLTVEDLVKLQSVNDPISIEEVIAIYLPLSRLLSLYVAATQGLFKATQRFLMAEDGKVPSTSNSASGRRAATASQTAPRRPAATAGTVTASTPTTAAP